MEKVMSTKMVKQIGSPKSEVYKKLDLSLSVQRGLVWTDDQKSLLVHSFLDGFVVPPILLDDRQDGFYRLIDGKQRTNCIQSFYADGFKISANTPPLSDGREINGLKYSKLPEDLKEKLDTAEIVMWHIRGLTDELRDEMFTRVNAGTSLLRSELTRALAGHDVAEYLNSLSVRDFFAKRVILSTVGRKRKLDHDLILQCLSLIVMRNSSFSGKDLQKFAIEMKSSPLSEETKAEVSTIVDYLEQAFPEVDGEPDYVYDELKKVSVPIIVKIAQVMMHNSQPAEDLYDFVSEFFNGKNRHGITYKSHSASATATKKNIRKRFEIMLTAFVEKYPNTVVPASCDFSEWDRQEEEAKAEALRIKEEKRIAKSIAQAERMAKRKEKAEAKANPSPSPALTAEQQDALDEAILQASREEDEQDLTIWPDEDEDEDDGILDAVLTSEKRKVSDEELDEALAFLASM